MTQSAAIDQAPGVGPAAPGDVTPAVTETAGRAFAGLFRMLKLARPMPSGWMGRSGRASFSTRNMPAKARPAASVTAGVASPAPAPWPPGVWSFAAECVMVPSYPETGRNYIRPNRDRTRAKIP